MKKYINYIVALTAVAMLGACSKDEPFRFGESEGEGQLLKSALNVSVPNAEGTVVASRPELTRALIPTSDEFTIDFIKTGETEPVRSYLYSEMPEVVTLPIGTYQAVAHYGTNPVQGWESPYYQGSTAFSVVADKITSDVAPINARLSNVRVSIVFAPSLVAAMSPNAKVTVKVGDSGTLDFTPDDADRSGYFAYVENSNSLTATFSGEVEGYPVVESKVYDTVAPGSHYRVTFRLHDAGEDDPGQINNSLAIDASVEIVNMNVAFDPEDEEILEDDLRPAEGEPENPGPGPDEPGGNPPAATALEPTDDYAGFNKLDLSKVNEANDNLYCAWNVSSEADGGFLVFTVDIISNTLTPGELIGVGLTDHIDLINPGQYEEALGGLGFPVNVGGQQSANFDITSFLPMLSALGEGNHEFRLTVKDANGQSVISVKLHTN